MNKDRRHKKRKKHTFRKRSSLSLVVVSFVLLLIYAFTSLQRSDVNIPETFESKAAIVDHLSLIVPNQTFTQTATSILEQAGFTVDYYLGEEVTVEFYRNLATHRYGLIIMRVHSSATWGAKIEEAPVTLFTSERASKTKYVYEQLMKQLFWVSYSDEEAEKGTLYFGITPLFVSQSMKGRFQNTTVIMMGCEGLDNTLMAKAFVEKGAKVYISWNRPVLASHTDSATTHLLQHFLIEGLTLKEAIRETSKDVGPDPVYKSLLTYYPLEAGDYTIRNIIGSITTNTREIITTQDVLRKRSISGQQNHL